MKRILFLISAVMWVMLCPAFVNALDVEIVPSSQIVQQWDFSSYDLKIHNDLGEKQSFLVSIDGPYLHWKIPGNVLLVIDDGQTRTSKITFRPTKEGVFDYKVRVSPFSNPLTFTEETFSMQVLGGTGLRNLKTSLEGENLRVSLDVFSAKESNIVVTMEIIDSKGMRVTSYDYPVAVDGIRNIKQNIFVEELLAGSYKIRAVSGDAELESSFEISPVRDVVRERNVNSGILRDEITIIIRNEGNVIESFAVDENVRADAFTGFVTKPENCITTENVKDCEFNIQDMFPGEKREITYTIEHWPNYAKYATGLIALVLIGVYSVGEVSKPRIKKKVIKRAKGGHTVIIEVRNPIRNLDNVIVRDFVSPLAKVHKKFEHVKPVKKTSDAGTELIWKVGKMKPREERILSYKIKPLVGGDLKMPKAYLRFRNKQGERIKVFSKHLTV